MFRNVTKDWQHRAVPASAHGLPVNAALQNKKASLIFREGLSVSIL